MVISSPLSPITNIQQWIVGRRPGASGTTAMPDPTEVNSRLLFFCRYAASWCTSWQHVYIHSWKSTRLMGSTYSDLRREDVGNKATHTDMARKRGGGGGGGGGRTIVSQSLSRGPSLKSMPDIRFGGNQSHPLPGVRQLTGTRLHTWRFKHWSIDNVKRHVAYLVDNTMDPMQLG